MTELATLPDRPQAAPTSTSLVLDASIMDSMMRMAELMASGRATIPEHLRKSPADCMAIVMQAVAWGMNPYAVASKTHVTQGGALGYEAQLINSVVISRAPIASRPEYEFVGDWSKVLGKVEERKSDKGGKYYVATYTRADEAGLGVIVSCLLRGEDRPRTVTVMMSQAYPRFSTQWATDPQQQICYLAIRKWARRYTPDVLLGVYTPEELTEPDGGPVDMGTIGDVREQRPAGPGAGQQEPAKPALRQADVLAELDACATHEAAKAVWARINRSDAPAEFKVWARDAVVSRRKAIDTAAAARQAADVIDVVARPVPADDGAESDAAGAAPVGDDGFGAEPDDAS